MWRSKWLPCPQPLPARSARPRSAHLQKLPLQLSLLLWIPLPSSPQPLSQQLLPWSLPERMSYRNSLPDFWLRSVTVPFEFKILYTILPNDFSIVCFLLYVKKTLGFFCAFSPICFFSHIFIFIWFYFDFTLHPLTLIHFSYMIL